MDFVRAELLDQQREVVNTRQRFQAYRAAAARKRTYRGSMVWSASRGRDYLMRADYDKTGKRKQASLGPRSETTEAVKTEFERKRAEVDQAIQAIQVVMTRQAAINRALGLVAAPR